MSKRKQFQPIRWTLARAGSEFGLSPKTVAQRVKAAGVTPGKDSMFSTVQIHGAICGDYERERTRKMAEEADAKAMENAARRKELVDVQDFFKRLEPVTVNIKQKIMGSALSDAEKDGLLADIANYFKAGG